MRQSLGTFKIKGQERGYNPHGPTPLIARSVTVADPAMTTSNWRNRVRLASQARNDAD